MAKKSSTLGNMLLSLIVIAVVAGAVLGFVYSLTKEPIAQVEKAKNEAAIKAVLEKEGLEINHIEEYTIDDLTYNVAYNADNEILGAAVKTSSGKGFSGKIELMVGLLHDGTINKISVLTQSETPGLGANMVNEKFKGQFNDKNPATFRLKVKQDNGDVDAITAATISSRAFSEAVQLAYDGFMKNKEQFNTKGDYK